MRRKDMGWTALCIASLAGHVDSTRALVRAGELQPYAAHTHTRAPGTLLNCLAKPYLESWCQVCVL